jgi:hypothetical protein
MFDLAGIDVEEIATALADQTDYEHRWLFDPRTGQVVFWTSDTGIDGENSVEIDELDLISIDPIPSYVWYQDMVDFAEGISDDALTRRGGHLRRRAPAPTCQVSGSPASDLPPQAGGGLARGRCTHVSERSCRDVGHPRIRRPGRAGRPGAG